MTVLFRGCTSAGRAQGFGPGGSRLTLAPWAGPRPSEGFRTLRHMPAAATSRLRAGPATSSLAVREHSPAGPGRPTVVLVHGYPDQQDDLGRPGRPAAPRRAGTS